MKKMILVIVSVLVVITGFFTFRDQNSESVGNETSDDASYREETERVNSKNERDKVVEGDNAPPLSTDPIFDESILMEHIETFINLYYDWNYSRTHDVFLEDYVTDEFFENITENIGISGEYVDGEEDDAFFNFDALVEIGILNIYVPISFTPSRNFDVLVEFDVLVDVPYSQPFLQKVIIRLDIEYDNGSFRINNKINV